MKRRSFTLVEVIASLVIVALCFGLALQALSLSKRTFEKQSSQIESGLDRLYMRSFLIETLGQAKPAFFPVGVLGDKKGIAFFFENFADPDPRLCGGAVGLLFCDSKGALVLDIREFDMDKRLLGFGRRALFLKGVKNWKLETLDLKKSKEWIEKRAIVLSDLCDAIRLTFSLEEEKISLVINLACANEVKVVAGGLKKTDSHKEKEPV